MNDHRRRAVELRAKLGLPATSSNAKRSKIHNTPHYPNQAQRDNEAAAAFNRVRSVDERTVTPSATRTTGPGSLSLSMQQKAIGLFGVKFRGSHMVKGCDSVSIPGATASLVHVDDKRITATRIVAIGVFALAAKKKKASLVLIEDTAGQQLVLETKKPDEAQKWCLRFNQQVN